MKSMNPKIEDNPAWKPYLEAVSKADWSGSLLLFIRDYPLNLQSVVALGLSLIKWHLIMFTRDHPTACGCCAIHREDLDCSKCPLYDGPQGNGCIYGTGKEVYSYILKVYTKYFDALSEEDKQSLA